jgi:hypothetical protein
MVSVEDLAYVGDKATAKLKFRFRVYIGKVKDEHKSVFLNGEAWHQHAEYLANKFAELQGKGTELKNITISVNGTYDTDVFEARDGSGKKELPKVANARVNILTAGDSVPF